GCRPEAFGEAHEIRVAEVAGDDPVAEAFLLIAPHIAKGTVIEDYDRERDAVVNSRRHLGRREHESAVTRDRDHRQGAARILDAKRRRIAPAERVLEARRDERARPISRVKKAGREAHLRDLLDENPVLRELGTDRLEVADLGCELGKPCAELALSLQHLAAPP